MIIRRHRQVLVRLLALLLGMSGEAAAVSPVGPLGDVWRWVHFTTSSGLPSNAVVSIVESGDGTPWALTAAGIAYFDGFRWNAVDPTAFTSLRYTSGNISPDTAGVFFCTNSRGYQVSRTSFTPLPPRHNDAPLPIYSAVRLDAHRVLVQSNRELFIIGDGGIRSLPSPFEDSVSARLVLPHQLFPLVAGRVGQAWLSTSTGIYTLEGDQWKLRMRPLRSLQTLRAVAGNAAGSGLAAFVLEPGHGVLMQWNRAEPATPIDPAKGEVLISLDLGPDGDAVAICYSGVALQRHRGTWSVLASEGAFLTPRYVRFRENGDLWVVTEHGISLCRRSMSLWDFWVHPSPDRRNAVREILPVSDGSFWLGTDGGVEIRERDGRTRMITSILGHPLGLVTALAEDRDHHIWVASGGSIEGAYRWDGVRWKQFSVKEGLDAPRVHRIVKDRSGDLWFLGIGALLPNARVSAEPGAFRFDGKRFHRIGPENGLPDGRVYAFAQDSAGALWFGSWKGISRFHNGQWRYWGLDGSLRTLRVFALAIDPQGQVWFAHQQDGLGVIDTSGRVRYFTTEDGLASNAVWSITFDSRGRLWAGTDGGLTCYRNGRFLSFTTANGLSNTKLWPIVARGDSLLIGSLGGGVNILALDQLPSVEPRIDLAEPYVRREATLLRWETFSVWGEVPPEQIETRFAVDGGPWSQWSNARQLELKDLTTGFHSFNVQARGFGVNAGPAVAGVSFEVPPPTVLRPVFLFPFLFLLFLLIGTGLSFFLHKQKTDAALREQDVRYRTIIERSSDGIMLADEHGLIVTWNRGAETMSGVPKRDVVGTRLIDLLARLQVNLDTGEPLSSHFAAGIERYFRVGTAPWLQRVQKWGLRRADGALLSIEQVMFPVKTERGFMLGSIVRDVTDRIRAEEELRQTAATLKAIIDASPAGIFLLDPSANVLLWNGAAERIFAWTAAEVVGASVPCIPSETHNEFEAILARARRGETVAGEEFRWRRKDGNEVDVSLSAAPLGSSTVAPVRIVCVVGNISDRKRVERESAEYLRQLRALSQRIETIREEERTWIAREIHDELGQALTGIRIDLGWLQGKLFPGQSVLEERTTSMIHLVDSTIAAIQRIAAELRPVLLDDFGLAPAIEWHAEEFQRRTGIRCVLDLVEDLERIPDSVATTVFRVFQEGLTNVARHARASSVHVTLSRRDGRLLLEVADDGCGVNPDVIASGRAIGIIGMRERVRALQGIFHLTGRPGEGTTIRIELPLDGGGTA